MGVQLFISLPMSDDFIGPAPPPHLAQSVNGEQKRKKEERDQEEPKQETKRSGPASPPRKRRRMGPSLDDLVAPPPPQEVMIGPPLPENLAPSGSEEPEDLDRQWDEVLKRNATTSGAEKKGKREDWMLSLPQSRRCCELICLHPLLTSMKCRATKNSHSISQIICKE